MENPKINLRGQEYQGILDFKALSLIQYNLKKNFDMELSMGEIFESIDKQDLVVLLEVVVHAIQRVHEQVTRSHIERQVGLGDLKVLYAFISELVENALPNG